MKNFFNILLGIGIFLAVLAICFFVFHIPDFYPQILAIIASACLGAGATAWITRLLLDSQKKAEEEKEKNIKIYENKIAVYSEFISKLWKTMADGYLNEDELRDIRSEVFNKLIFYLGIEDIKKLSKEIEGIKELQPKLSEDNESINSKDSGTLVTIYSEITNILRNDINKGKGDNDALKVATNELSALWTGFGIQPVELAKEKQAFVSVTSQDNNVICPTPLTTEKNNEVPSQDTHNKKGFVQAWHFAMLGDEQIKALDKGINELSLIEYEEEWRTNLMKQVGENDIVFLFRRGGCGYIGAFRPKGWRIFERDDDEKPYETIHLFEKENDEIVKEEALVNADVEKYDIYRGVKDTADFCSNLMVEPLVLDYKGVSYPGGVYRRTISRYDNGYAKEVLSRFMTKKDDPSFNKIEENGETINVRTDLFEELTRNLHPAERDENGDWK